MDAEGVDAFGPDFAHGFHVFGLKGSIKGEVGFEDGGFGGHGLANEG